MNPKIKLEYISDWRFQAIIARTRGKWKEKLHFPGTKYKGQKIKKNFKFLGVPSNRYSGAT